MPYKNIVSSYRSCNLWDFLVKLGYKFGNHISSGRQLNCRNSTAKVSGFFPGRVLNCRRISTVFTVNNFKGFSIFYRLLCTHVRKIHQYRRSIYDRMQWFFIHFQRFLIYTSIGVRQVILPVPLSPYNLRV